MILDSLLAHHIEQGSAAGILVSFCDIWVRNEKKMVFNHRRKSTFQWEPFFVGCQLEIQVSLVLWPIFCCFCPSLVQILREHRPTWKGKSSRSEKRTSLQLYFECKFTKGQLISKQNCQAVTSSKKRTKDFCPGSLLLQG